jgi:uncharacterized lipoprotein YajG
VAGKSISCVIALAALAACTAQPPTPEWAKFRGTPHIQPIVATAVASPAGLDSGAIAVIVPLDKCAIVGGAPTTEATVRAAPLVTKAARPARPKRVQVAAARRAPMGPEL